jgi:catechol-2,3-dioxygenase
MTKIDHINLTAANLKQSTDWYSKLFGFKEVESGISSAGKSWAILACNDSMICMTELADRLLASLDQDRTHHKLMHFGLRISDADAWREMILKYKLKVQYGGPVDYPHSTSWYLNDPSGHEIEVSWCAEGKMHFGS